MPTLGIRQEPTAPVTPKSRRFRPAHPNLG